MEITKISYHLDWVEFIHENKLYHAQLTSQTYWPDDEPIPKIGIEIAFVFDGPLDPSIENDPSWVYARKELEKALCTFFGTELKLI